MSNRDIIRAWKDADYRASLGADALALVPGHPAGWIEVADLALDAVSALRGLRVRTAIKAGGEPTRDCGSLDCA